MKLFLPFDGPKVKNCGLWLVACGSAGHESVCNVEDLGLTPGLGRSPREGKGYTLQYSGLENSMDCIVHGGPKESDTTERLSLSTREAMFWLHSVK